MDATVLAYLVNLYEMPFVWPMKDFALICQNLIAYKDRVKESYYPELMTRS